MAVTFVFLTFECSAQDQVYKDVAYLQKWPVKYSSDSGAPAGSVSDVEVCSGRTFAGTEEGIYVFDGETWELDRKAEGIKELRCDERGLYVSAKQGLLFAESAVLPDMDFIYRGDVETSAAWKGGLLVGGASGLLFVEGDAVSPVADIDGIEVYAVEVAGGKAAWISTGAGLIRYDGKSTRLFFAGNEGPGLIDNDVRDICADETGAVFIGTGKGISRYDDAGGWEQITGRSAGLPYEDVTSIDFRDGVLLVGTKFGGAIRRDGSWEYFQSRRYLPDDYVNDVEIDPDGSLWFATTKGVSKIEYRSMTLQDKADYFQRDVQKYHNRLNFISDAVLREPGDVSTSYPVDRDNDGLWTSMYIAAECYRYGVTGDPAAKRNARNSLDAMMFLETVTEVPGLFARSYTKIGEHRGPGEWNDTPDGRYSWKGDTSSDEAVGHFYSYFVYYNICADEKEKELIRDKVGKIAGYIVDNGYELIDVDGEPTTFGRWSPEYFSSTGVLSKGLNSLEILSHIKVAHYITGNDKFLASYRTLVKKYNYAKNTVNQKYTNPGVANHSDDELAFLSYYPLLKLEKNRKVLKYYQRSISRTWEAERPEKNPLWNFIYGAVMPEGTFFDVEGAAETLKLIPVDLVYHRVRNSQRADIEISDIKDRFKVRQAAGIIRPDERGMLKWNENPYKLDSKRDERQLESAGFWLLPYWMGRYYGFID